MAWRGKIYESYLFPNLCSQFEKLITNIGYLFLWCSQQLVTFLGAYPDFLWPTYDWYFLGWFQDCNYIKLWYLYYTMYSTKSNVVKFLKNYRKNVLRTTNIYPNCWQYIRNLKHLQRFKWIVKFAFQNV